MQLDVSHAFLPKQHSTRAAQVMDHFGIGFEQGRHVIAAGLEIPIEPGNVVLFNGASGSGKSSLLRGVAEGLRRGGGNSESSCCGMQADGSSGLTTAQRADPSPPAPLPACRVKEMEHDSAGRGGMSAVLDVNELDLAADLDADVRVVCRLDGEVAIRRREEASDLTLTPGPSPGVTSKDMDSGSAGRAGTARKKKEQCRSRGSCGSARRPSATGRTSLGGITAAITSG